MIRVGTIYMGNFRHETSEEAIQRYMNLNQIADDDVINIIPNNYDPDKLTIYYKEKEF